jgi:hypothetical protein
MKKLLLIIIILISGFTLSFGQNISRDSLKLKYERETVYIKMGKYIKNGVKTPIGFWGSALEKEFKFSNDGQKEYQLYRKRVITGFLIMTAGYAVGILGPSLGGDKINTSIPLAAGFGLICISIPITINGSNHLTKAIWLRNRDVLLQ